MALATHTIAINAAFLQEIKEDHHELRQLMHHTAAMLQRPAWMPAERDRLVEMLSKLRDQLAMHFSLEEAYGYFEDAIDTAPHLCDRAECLRNQHAELYRQLASLADRAEQLLYHEAASGILIQMADDYRSFTARFTEHEARESELILEAVNSDIGTGD